MWHLLLNNLKGRFAYSLIIVCAVALALAVALTAALMTGGVQKDLEHKQRLLGPELALVPPGTKETGHIYLTKGPPGHGVIPAGALEKIKSFPEVDAVSTQKIVGDALIHGKRAMLIAFDPSTDFMVKPWLDSKSGKSFEPDSGEVLLGAMLAPEKRPGDSLQLEGKNRTIAGRLRNTGSFMDFTMFSSLPPGEVSGDPSWILIRLKQGASVDLMINKLETHIPQVEVIARPEMLKTIDSQIQGVVQGGGLSIAAALVAAGALLVTGAMFALLIYERRREFGLLKAMGARNSFIFRLIIAEVAVLGAVGGTFGLLLSWAWLALSGAESIPGDGSALSALAFALGRAVLALALTIGVCALTAVFPAWLAARMEPYAAIRKGE